MAAAPAAPAAASRLVIGNVNVLSMDSETGDGVRTVVVEGGRVVEVVPRPALEVYRRGDTLLRGEGLWLMPGLIDGAVATVDPADLRLHALAGVTSVVHDCPAATAWLEPLVTSTDARLPSIFAADQRAERPAGDRPAPRGSQLALLDAPARWVRAGRPAAPLAMLDPATAARWRALAATPADEVEPSEAALARARLLRTADWVVASGSGHPFMPPHVATVDEMLALREAGFEPDRILQAATVEAAEAIGRPDLGRIRAGAAADLLLLEADPREDLAALRRVRAVVLRGELLRAAEIESTRDLLAELRNDQAAALAAEHAADGAPSLSRRWLIRFDGLPRGVRSSTATPLGPGRGWLCVDRTVMWSPLRSRLEIVTQREPDGSATRLELDYEATGDLLRATIDRQPAAWRLSLERDGERSERLLADPSPAPRSPTDAGPPVPAPTAGGPEVDRGTAARPPMRLVAAPVLEGTPLCELWPSTFDLRLLALRAPATVPVAEFSFGVGPPSWRRARVAVTRRAAPDARRTAIERSLRSAPWASAATPQGGDGPTLVGLALGAAPSESAGLEALLARLGSAAQLAGFYVVDSQSWPVVGRFLVPEGLWEFHPLDEAPTCRAASP